MGHSRPENATALNVVAGMTHRDCAAASKAQDEATPRPRLTLALAPITQRPAPLQAYPG
jgi:hypothetical protein